MPLRNVSPELPGDPSVILGVGRYAGESEIRAAWKKVALRTHPDKCGDDGTAFRTAKAAYEALLPSAAPTFSYDHSRRRNAKERRRRAERPASCKAAERARAAEERAKTEEAEARESATRQRYAEQRRRAAENDRRMQTETVRAYEERLFRQRSEAYHEDLQSRAEKIAKERKEVAATKGPSFADRSAERNNDRFKARYMRYMQRKMEQLDVSEGGQPPPPPQPPQQSPETEAPAGEPPAPTGQEPQPTPPENEAPPDQPPVPTGQEPQPTPTGQEPPASGGSPSLWSSLW